MKTARRFLTTSLCVADVFLFVFMSFITSWGIHKNIPNFFSFLNLSKYIYNCKFTFKLYSERLKVNFNLKQKTLWQRKRRKLRKSQLRSLRRKQARKVQRKARRKAPRNLQRERSNARIADHFGSRCNRQKPEYCVLRFF